MVLDARHQATKITPKLSQCLLSNSQSTPSQLYERASEITLWGKYLKNWKNDRKGSLLGINQTLKSTGSTEKIVSGLRQRAPVGVMMNGVFDCMARWYHHQDGHSLYRSTRLVSVKSRLNLRTGGPEHPSPNCCLSFFLFRVLAPKGLDTEGA